MTPTDAADLLLVVRAIFWLLLAWLGLWLALRPRTPKPSPRPKLAKGGPVYPRPEDGPQPTLPSPIDRS